jgi:GMP synthase-like glutamine amidotransferase
VATALAISHIVENGLGTLEEWLPAAGLDLDVVRTYADEKVPTELPAGYDALVVMGGAPNVDEGHDWLEREQELLRGCVASGVPTMGVCLGAQVLALACGGAVTRGFAPEIGAGRIELRPEAKSDPLFAGMPDALEAVQWHWYGVDRLPPDAVWLASAPAYPHQAFRLWDHAWGIQFHPEAPPHQVSRWADEDSGRIRAAGLDPETVRREATGLATRSPAVWQPFFARFAALA